MLNTYLHMVWLHMQKTARLAHSFCPAATFDYHGERNGVSFGWTLWILGVLVPAHATPSHSADLVENQEVTIVNLATDVVGSVAVERLSKYLEACLGRKAAITYSMPETDGGEFIVLGGPEVANLYSITSPFTGSDESYSLTTVLKGGPLAVISGTTGQGIKRGVQHFILLTQQIAPGTLRIPSVEIVEKPWKSSREYMLVNWSPDDVRAKFSNRSVNKQVDVVYRYSDEQLFRYVEMFDQLGFSGVQLGESSVSWSVSGSKEAYQDRIRKVAEAARSVGQHVSYLFWAAEFNVGWSDIEQAYEPAAGNTAFEDPSIRAYFEKHYDHYSKMAEHVDLVIGHWFDAGRLASMNDVINYQKLLRDKMRAKNPDLRFAVNTWGHPEFYDALLEAGMNDFLLLEMSMPFAVSQDERIEFRRRAKENGFEVGIWGWYMTEYETDQVPNMHVNGHVMKEYITNIRNGAEKIYPSSYWSEMEAYHIANIYTMYQTAQLLWDPDRDPDELLSEITDAIWGPRDAQSILDALKLIEEVRSGYTWETFSYLSPSRLDGTYDPADDARRATESLRALATLTPDPDYVPKLTLPVSRETLIEIKLPHLEQIRLFAEFRLAFNEVRDAFKRGVEPDVLRAKISEIWQPIPEFDTWIGTYGQAEAWRQDKMLFELSEQAGVAAPVPAWKRIRDQRRFLETMESMQRVEPNAVTVKASLLAGEFGGIYANEEYAKGLLDEMVVDGFLKKYSDNEYQLLRWQEVAFLLRSRLGLIDYSLN